jgi:uncharacterized protein YcbK (DUF882 family)
MTLTRTASRLGLAGLLLLGAIVSLQSASAEDDTRTLSFHHVHTGEDLTVTFKRDGHYVPSALKKLDWFMRDWRQNKEVHMDPHLFDVLWQVYREVGATQPIQIICGYRAPGTNAMLRERSGGVAMLSQHILGKAIDFYIPGVPLAKIRTVGLELQRGGVGFYPTSGSPFVHLDVGSVRHWPSIPREALVKIFPQGKTVHIPADGQPLPGYAQALAEVERRGNVPSERSLAAAREAGLITAKQEQVAESIDEARRQPLIAMVDTGKGHDYPAPAVQAPVVQASAAQGAPLMLASFTTPQRAFPHPGVPLPPARPQPVVTVATAKAAAKPAMTASLSGDAGAPRNIWGDIIERNADWRNADTMPSFDVAAANPNPGNGAANDTPADATDSSAMPADRARPMGASLPRLPREATLLPAAVNTTVAVKPPAMTSGSQRSNSPWLRATILTPSVRNTMTATRLNKIDPDWLGALLEKPAQSVMMSFSADPHLGMVADRFTGPAVVFLATATFTTQTTASLR